MGEVNMQQGFMRNYPGYIQYVVQPNDSLYKIAKSYNTTVDGIKQINNLVSNTIYPNQILYVPMSSTHTASNNTYLTKNGESLDEILTKFNISVNDFTFNNDIGKLKLKENQLVSTDCRTNNVYMVSDKDTIEDILAKFNLSPLEFLKLNEKQILEKGKGIIIN